MFALVKGANRANVARFLQRHWNCIESDDSTSLAGRRSVRSRVFHWLSLCSCVSTANAQDWAKRMFTKTAHDFGTVVRGAKTEFRFTFKNIYVEDVHVASVRSSCGCTTPEITKRDLKTYETSYVLATYNTHAFVGHRSATVTVTFDKPFYAEVQLQVSGNIRGDIVVQPNFVNLGTVNQGQATEAHDHGHADQPPGLEESSTCAPRTRTSKWMWSNESRTGQCVLRPESQAEGRRPGRLYQGPVGAGHQRPSGRDISRSRWKGSSFRRLPSVSRSTLARSKLAARLPSRSSFADKSRSRSPRSSATTNDSAFKLPDADAEPKPCTRSRSHSPPTANPARSARESSSRPIVARRLCPRCWQTPSCGRMSRRRRCRPKRQFPSRRDLRATPRSPMSVFRRPQRIACHDGPTSPSRASSSSARHPRV